jgi:hypothetical protein
MVALKVQTLEPKIEMDQNTRLRVNTLRGFIKMLVNVKLRLTGEVEEA